MRRFLDIPARVRARQIIVHVRSDIYRVKADGIKRRGNRVLGKVVKVSRAVELDACILRVLIALNRGPLRAAEWRAVDEIWIHRSPNWPTSLVQDQPVISTHIMSHA